jgi:hypothetical protein
MSNILIERIVYSQELIKVNDYDKSQKRILAFSNKRIINFDGKSKDLANLQRLSE